MNNIFELKRFGRLLKSDISFYWSQQWVRFLSVVVAVPIVGLLVSKTSVEERGMFFIFMALTYALFTQFKVYGGVNNKKGGVDYLMLPASSLEKFISMVLLSAICLPILMILSIFAVDSLLVAIPWDRYYSQYISFADIFNENMQRIWLAYIVTATVFIYCNLLFKKSKAAKTVLVVIVATIIMSSASFAIIYKAAETEIEKLELVDKSEVSSMTDSKNKFIYFEDKTYYVDDETSDILEAKYIWIVDVMEILFYGVLPVIMLTLSYCRIRRMQI